MKNLTLFVYCKVRAFLADEEGANAIEYAVIAGLIAVALIAVLSPTDSGIVGSGLTSSSRAISLQWRHFHGATILPLCWHYATKPAVQALDHGFPPQAPYLVAWAPRPS